MPSKEFHNTRIKELRFQRDIKINQDNRNHITLIALLSVVVVFLSYELTSNHVKSLWLICLYVIFLVLLWAINRENKYPKNKTIQNNFDYLLGRKK